MCGRYLLTAPVDALAGLFGFENRPNLAPRWNIAPTQEAAAVRPVDGGRRLDMLRWGLLPHWAKEAGKGPPLINARGETVAEKPAFRDAFRRRRVLAPASGFYEWAGKGADKRAYFARPPGPIAFAAIASLWRGQDGREIESFAIVTAEATGPIAEIHHRAPVVVAPENAEQWMTGAPEDALDLIRPPADDQFEIVEIDGRVGDVRQDDAGLVEPAAQKPKPGQMSLF